MKHKKTNKNKIIKKNVTDAWTKLAQAHLDHWAGPSRLERRLNDTSSSLCSWC
jgi:hypothetical protein